MSTELPGDGIEYDIFDPEAAKVAEKRAEQLAEITDDQLHAFVQRRKLAYAKVFGNTADPDVLFVLEDLAFFARANRTAFHQDPRVHALVEGRREVYYRIVDYARLPTDLLYEKIAVANTQRT